MLKGIKDNDQLWGGPDNDDNTKNTNWQMSKGTYNVLATLDTRDVFLLTHMHKTCGLYSL